MFAPVRRRVLGSVSFGCCLLSLVGAPVAADPPARSAAGHAAHQHAGHARPAVEFQIRSVRDGAWSDKTTWDQGRTPRAGDRVLVSRGTTVTYDVASDEVVRLLQVVGTLRFSREHDTLLNVGVLKVQESDVCSESGFACDFEGVNVAGEPQRRPDRARPTLEIGTRERPIPPEHTARIRLHYLEGVDKNDAPALVCCAARMELHGAPMSSWHKLAMNVGVGEREVTLAEAPRGWRVGDTVIVTGSERVERGGSYRGEETATEERRVTSLDGARVTLDRPLDRAHLGEGEFRSEVANLTRNVVVESADPAGTRGHTLYHAYSEGGISHARFAHLGKEGVLGRYSIHFHLIGDTMRGSAIEGVAIVDSHNRWITIHGTEYLVVRDCVGYRSVGHGFFLEDGTEVYNLLEHNLAVQAYRGKRLPQQVLPFDPNDGAGFWWANGRNTLVRNVSCENDEYGYRYDMQHSRYFNSTLPVRMADGERREIDVRTIPIWRFEGNEAHTEGVYGVVVAANGGNQPDSPIDGPRMLEEIRRIDWTGPDTSHPHHLRDVRIWEVHYGLRPHSPSMWIEQVRIHSAAYGIYRPAFENQVFRDLHISAVGAEPFNRGMDDASAQIGSITVDGLIFESGYGDRSTPFIQISDNGLGEGASTHLRNVETRRPEQYRDRWPLLNRGVGPRPRPLTDGVPVYLHDYYGPGRHAKVVSTAAADLLSDGSKYHPEPPLTGDESVVAEVTDIPWPELLTPVDDEPPATIVLATRIAGDQVVVEGVSHDNGEVVRVEVNGQTAERVNEVAATYEWRIILPLPADGRITARATDHSGNIELTPHELAVR